MRYIGGAHWCVADAKVHLSEMLRRARAGEPQVIGTRQSCVVTSADSDREKIEDARGHDGRWLIAAAARVGFDILLPPRDEDRPELDWFEEP